MIKFQKLVQQGLGLILIMVFLFGCSTQQGVAPSKPPEATQMSASPASQAPAGPTGAATPLAAPSGKFEVNGRSLTIECLGTGSPTMVLESGEGGTHLDMAELQKRLATRTMTCAYDRANTGSLRTAQDVVDDLNALLAVAGVPGPFVLVGTSGGGFYVQLYARTFPNEVVGVVAMNPVPPAHPWLEEVSQIFTAQEYADEEAYYGGNNEELLDYLSSSKQLADSAIPSTIPFEMLISTIMQCDSPNDVCGRSYSTYEQIERDVAASWPRGNFSQVAAGHEIFRDDIDAVLAAVDRVLVSP